MNGDGVVGHREGLGHPIHPLPQGLAVETKPISALVWCSIAGMALAGLCCEYALGWIMFFSPGWANDPLFGPNFHAVLATAMTGWVSLLLMTAAVGAGAIVGFLCTCWGPVGGMVAESMGGGSCLQRSSSYS